MLTGIRQRSADKAAAFVADSTCENGNKAARTRTRTGRQRQRERERERKGKRVSELGTTC